VLCVVDGSSDEWKKHYEVTESTLRDLKCEAPLITVINKCDKIENPQYFPKDSILISALTGMGIERLIESVNQFFLDRYKTVTLFYPFAKIGEYHKAAADITVLEENYTEEGVLVNARIPKIQKDRFRPFLYKEKRK
jgi:GTP-binding protein HflX